MGEGNREDICGSCISKLHLGTQSGCFHHLIAREHQERFGCVRNGHILETLRFVAVLIQSCPGNHRISYRETVLRRVAAIGDREDIRHLNLAQIVYPGFDSRCFQPDIRRYGQNRRGLIRYFNGLGGGGRIAVLILGRPGNQCLAYRKVGGGIIGPFHIKNIRCLRLAKLKLHSSFRGFHRHILGNNQNRWCGICHRNLLNLNNLIAVGILRLPLYVCCSYREVGGSIMSERHLKNIMGLRLSDFHWSSSCRCLQCNRLWHNQLGLGAVDNRYILYGCNRIAVGIRCRPGHRLFADGEFLGSIIIQNNREDICCICSRQDIGCANGRCFEHNVALHRNNRLGGVLYRDFLNLGGHVPNRVHRLPYNRGCADGKVGRCVAGDDNVRH